MEMYSPEEFIFMQNKLIFLRKVLQETSIWNRGTRWAYLRNGLLQVALQAVDLSFTLSVHVINIITRRKQEEYSALGGKPLHDDRIHHHISADTTCMFI